MLELEPGILFQKSTQQYIAIVNGQRVGSANNIQLARALQFSALNPNPTSFPSLIMGTGMQTNVLGKKKNK